MPVVHEQVHAMVRIGYRSVKCCMPELDATSRMSASVSVGYGAAPSERG